MSIKEVLRVIFSNSIISLSKESSTLEFFFLNNDRTLKHVHIIFFKYTFSQIILQDDL